MNIKVWLLGIMLLLLVSVASAESCFTAVNVPENDQFYWKAMTFSGIQDDNYDSYLTQTSSSVVVPSLGSGVQFSMRLDNNCFDNYLLSNIDVTGMTSSDINIDKFLYDYKTVDFIPNKFYTVSVSDSDLVSTGLVSQITTGFVDGVDYLSLPDSFSDVSNHLALRKIADSVCDSSLKISTQMDNIRLATWAVLTPSETVSSCNSLNMLDCVLSDGKADSESYAAINMVVARMCGVPTRVVRGISEGSFDGVDIIFDSSKDHFWIEFYDRGWFEKEVTEGGSSLPSTLETNCQDGIDNDFNGNIDCWDSACSNELICSNWPTTVEFANSFSTDLTSLPNPYSVNDLMFGNEHGSIRWVGQNIDVRGLSIDTAINITDNRLSVSVIDVPGVATLTGITNSVPKILRDGLVCTNCSVASFVDGVVTFDVPGVGVYSVAPVVVTNESVVPSVPAIVPSSGFLDSPVDWVKSQWSKLTSIGKIVLVVVLLAILYMFYKKKKQRFVR